MAIDKELFDDLLENLGKRQLFEEAFLKLKSETSDLYRYVLKEIHETISNNDLERFKGCADLFRCIVADTGSGIAEILLKNDDNPFAHYNPIVLACKFNADKVLSYILGKEGASFLDYWTREVHRKPLLPGDEDDDRHNAFYYTIRNGKISSARQLLTYWSANAELPTLLASTMEKLNLRNVSISAEMEFFISQKMVDAEFFNVPKNNLQRNRRPDQLGQRIEFLLKIINILCAEYMNNKPLDQKFSYVCQNVAKQIYILKKQLKPTYNQFPWEEMEFCAIAFWSSCFNRMDNYVNMFVRIFLTRDKFLRHLQNFSSRISAEKANLIKINSTRLPRTGRATAVAAISQKYPEFVELYEDFENIRDICSLNTISEQINILLKTDPDDEYASVVVDKVLQTTGEFVKNTLESPKLSSQTSRILQFTIPKNTFSTVTTLRNSLSHADSMSCRTEIAKKMDSTAIEKIQKDMKKVHGSINEILFKYQRKALILHMKNIANCETVDEFNELRYSFYSKNENVMRRLIKIEEKNCNLQKEKIRELTGQLDSEIENRTPSDLEFLNAVRELFDKEKEDTNFLDCFNRQKAISEFSQVRDPNTLRMLKRLSLITLKELEQNSKSAHLEDIAQDITRLQPRNALFNFSKSQIQSEKIRWQISYLASNEPKQIKWVESLMFDFDRDHKFKLQLSTENTTEEILMEKFRNLKNILSEHYTNSEGETVALKASNNMAKISIEMALLDIMSALNELNSKLLINNIFYLDGSYPIILGRELRNHLAHGNALTEIFPFQTDLAVLVSCLKMLEANEKQQFNESFKQICIGVSNNELFENLESRFDENINVIATQEKLAVALTEGNIEDMAICCKHGADLRGKTLDSETALHLAAKSGNVELVKSLIAQDFNPLDRDSREQNVLHISAHNGHAKLVEYLISETKMNVNEPLQLFESLQCKTALHMASENGHLETVKMLVNYEANKLMYYRGMSPLALAAINNHLDVVQYLFDSNSHLNAVMMADCTLLHCVAEHRCADVVRFLINEKAVVNSKNENGCIPLHAAALNGHVEVVNILLQNGSKLDANVKSSNGYASLHNSVKNDHFDVTKTLLEWGANPNLPGGTDNVTPVHIAASLGSADILKELISNGGDINAEACASGIKPIHCVARKGNLSSVKVLMKNGCQPPLNHAAFNGDMDIVEYLLDSSKNMESSNRAVLSAAQKGHTQIVEYLFSNGAVIDTSEATNALEMVLKGGHFDLIHLLLDKGAEITDKVHFLACNNVESLEKLLAKRPETISKRNSLGYTLLHNAIFACNEKVLKLLLTKGCDVDEPVKVVQKGAEPVSAIEFAEAKQSLFKSC